MMMPNDGAAGGLTQGASGRMETDDAGRRFFVTPDGQRVPMGGGGGHVTLPAGAGASAGSRVAMADGSSLLVGITPAEAAAHGAGGVAVAAPAVPAPVSPPAGGMAPGASGRMETDDAGRRFFVTPDGQRIPMGGGGGHVTLPAGAGGSAGSRVAMADGSSVLVGVTPAEAAAHTGGLAPAPGIAAPVLVAPAPRPAGDRLGGADAAPAPVAAAAPFTVAGTTQISDGDAIELRSEEIQEIISQVPHWLVRCGTTVFFLTVAALLGLSWMVRYPDMVDGRLTLTTPRPPVRIVARTSGELQQVLVSDNARVARGAALAVLKNPADWRDVFRLSQRLDAMGAALAGSTPLPAERFDPSLSLGDIQPAYAELMRRLSDYSAFGQGSYYREKIQGTERQLADHRQLQDRLAAQQRILVEQMQLAGRKHERSQQLAAGSLISQNDLDQSATDYLQSRYAVRNGESALTNNNIQLSTDAQALLDLRQKLLDEDRQQRDELRSAYDALRSAIRKWEQDYVLRAPVEGRVSLFEAARVDQFVVAAQPVMAVVPQAQSLVGTALISEARAGKVRVGQRVIVKLDSYPAQEYGAVEGRVAQISMLANEDGEGENKDAKYLVRVVFPRGLVTSYGKRIPFRQEMRGVGSVVTEDRRLIQRIFDQLLYAATASRA